MTPANLSRRPQPAVDSGFFSRAAALFSTLVMATCWLLGCDRASSKSGPEPYTNAVPELGENVPAASNSGREVHELLSQLPYCEVRHRGISIDPGSRWADGHRSFMIGPFDDVVPSERAGTTTGRVMTKKLLYDFWLDSPAQGIEVALRVQGQRSRRVSLYVDNLRLGESRVSRSESQVLRFGPVKPALEPGRHSITLRFSGTKAGVGDPFALLDWVRVYLPDANKERYAPPTARNLLQDVVLSGEPRRSLAIRSPGGIRCGVLATEGVRLKVDVGYWGVGEGVAQVLVHQKSGAPVVLAERKVVGKEGAAWTPLELSLDAFDQELVAVELVALQSSSAGRVVFGEPELIRKKPARTNLDARNVVVVVAGGLSRRVTPPWASRDGLSTVFSLTEQGTTFERYHTPSTLVTGVMATLVTGLSPSQHGVLDPAARLPDHAVTLSERVREAGGRSAMFTNVPYTFAGFGFESGWTKFQSFSPVEDRPGAEPVLAATKWLKAEIADQPTAKRLVLVHVRGGHPPWDVAGDELATLEPKEYNGLIQARRGAIVMRQIRNRRIASRRKLGPRDWRRLESLQLVALKKQDAALGSLIRTLSDAGEWDDTLFIYVGDVSMGDPPRVPFVPYGSLSQERLTPPLIVKFPRRLGAGVRNTQLVSTSAISRTLLRALGMEVPVELTGLDLGQIAEGARPSMGSTVLARQGQSYALYQGKYRLRGAIGARPGLCNLEVDPTCGHDLFNEEPFPAAWLWRGALRRFAKDRRGPTHSREAADIDERLRAALTVYGL